MKRAAALILEVLRSRKRPARAPKGQSKLKQDIAKAAEAVKFSDADHPQISRDDYDAIEKLMGESEKADMKDAIEQKEYEAIQDARGSAEFYVTEKEIADDAGYSNAKIGNDIRYMVGDVKELKDAVDDWRPADVGIDAIDDLVGKLKDTGVEIPEHIKTQIGAYRDQAAEEMEGAKSDALDSAKDSAEERAREDFDRDQVRRDYLRGVWDNHFSGGVTSVSPGKEIWYRSAADEFNYEFSSGTGHDYSVDVFKSGVGDLKNYEVQFRDVNASGFEERYGVSKAGAAHEVFSKVVPAVVALIKRDNPDSVTFSAEGKSRMRLYDRLVKTVTGMVDDRFALKYDDSPDHRLYGIGKKDQRTKLVTAFKYRFANYGQPEPDLQPLTESLADGPRPILEDVFPEINPLWFTPKGWAGPGGILLEDCGTGAGGFKPGNECGRHDGGGGEGGGASTATKAAARPTGAAGGGSGVGHVVTPQAAQNLLGTLKATGGFTYDALHDSMPKSGFVVSTRPQDTRIFTAEQMTTDNVQKYIDQNAATLKADPEAHIGAWLNEKTGEIVLDVTHVKDNQAEAERLGIQHQQDAIYDIATGKTIWLPKAGAASGPAAPAPAVPVQAGNASVGNRQDAAGSGGGSQKEIGGVRPPKDEADLARFVKDVQATPLAHQVETGLDKLRGQTKSGHVEDWSKEKFTDAAGKYNPQRAALHAEIVSKLLDPKSIAPAGQRPKALLTLGPPGAGKTTSVDREAARLGVRFTNINSDDVKGMLPEYRGWNGGALHAESNDIALGDLLGQAITGRHNIVYDSTGTNLEKMKTVVDSLTKQGYDVHLLNVTIPNEKAAERAWARFNNNPFSKDASKEPGRFVPLDFVQYVDHKPGGTYDKLKANPNIKGWSSVNNDVPYGTPPKELERGQR